MSMHLEIGSPELYEASINWMPWRTMQHQMLESVLRSAPKDGSVLDLMCGTGLLLREICKYRPDLRLTGVDLDEVYLHHAQKNHAGDATWINSDVRTWKPNERFDVVLCQGSLHHVSPDDQPAVIALMHYSAKPGGLVLLSDVCVRDWLSERSRRLAVTELGAAYIAAILGIGKDAPPEQLRLACRILENDLTGGEWKTSVAIHERMLEPHFPQRDRVRTWPERGIEVEYGEYVWTMRTGASPAH